MILKALVVLKAVIVTLIALFITLGKAKCGALYDTPYQLLSIFDPLRVNHMNNDNLLKF